MNAFLQILGDENSGFIYEISSDSDPKIKEVHVQEIIRIKNLLEHLRANLDLDSGVDRKHLREILLATFSGEDEPQNPALLNECSRHYYRNYSNSKDLYSEVFATYLSLLEKLPATIPSLGLNGILTEREVHDQIKRFAARLLDNKDMIPYFEMNMDNETSQIVIKLRQIYIICRLILDDRQISAEDRLALYHMIRDKVKELNDTSIPGADYCKNFYRIPLTVEVSNESDTMRPLVPSFVPFLFCHQLKTLYELTE